MTVNLPQGAAKAPAEYDVNAAVNFYRQHIYNSSLQQVFLSRGFSLAGTVHFRVWEVFAAELTDQARKIGNGADFEGYEVKSAQLGSGFEYQYHRNTGLEKLAEDKQVKHLFISYSPDYKNVIVRAVDGSRMAAFFDDWKDGLEEAYKSANPKQRYRKAIPFSWVKDNSDVILEIKETQLVASR